MFDCNRTKAEGTKRVCKISRQHQMHTPTRVLTLFHHSHDHSLSHYSTWYSKPWVCVSESNIIARLIVIEPKQKVQNEFVRSQDNMKCTLQHEYSLDSTTLSQFWTGYSRLSKRRICVSKRDVLEHLIVIEPTQKVQNEYASSQGSIKCTLQHEYSPYSATPTIIVYHTTRPGTLSHESA
jgi:hypothetical protein